MESLIEYLSIPSISAEKEHSSDMSKAAGFLKDLFETNNFFAKTFETEGHPLVFAEKIASKTAPTLLFYGHYDVQPVDPIEEWHSDPFSPKVENGRIYARGASDNKGSHFAMLLGLFEACNNTSVNIKCIIEGEEEIGSPSLPKFLEENKDMLACDLVVLSDTGCRSEEQTIITTALRGLMSLEIELEGPTRDLHSGVFGGGVYNPIQALTEICSSLHDENGKVNVSGFYDNILPPEDWEIEMVKPLENEAIECLGKAQLKDSVQKIRFYPTLEFNGILGGYTGEGIKTVIPKKAIAKISCRLVANQDAEDIFRKVKKTIETRCPKEMKLTIKKGHGGNPYLFLPPHKTKKETQPFVKKVFEQTESLAEKTFGKKPLYLREGGSIPIISTIQEELGAHSLMIGLTLPEDAIHAPNESFSLKLFERAKSFYKELLLAL